MSEFDSFTPTVADLDGQLVLVLAEEHLKDVETSFGMKDPIRASVTVLYPEGPVEYTDFQIFQARLIMKLKDRVGSGRWYLARIGKGAEHKGNVPWEFKPPTGADQKIARAYMAGESYGQVAVQGGGTASTQTGEITPAPTAPVADSSLDDPFAA